MQMNVQINNAKSVSEEAKEAVPDLDAKLIDYTNITKYDSK